MSQDYAQLIDSLCEESQQQAQRIAEVFGFCKKYIDIECIDRDFHKHTFDLQKCQFVDAKSHSQSAFATWLLRRLKLEAWLENMRRFSVAVLSFQDIFALELPADDETPLTTPQSLACHLPLDPASLCYKEHHSLEGSVYYAFDAALLQLRSGFRGHIPLCIISDLDIWKVILQRLYAKLESTHLWCRLVYPTFVIQIAMDADGLSASKNKSLDNFSTANSRTCLKSQSNFGKIASLEAQPSRLVESQPLLDAMSHNHSRLFLSGALQAICHICEEASSHLKYPPT